MIEDELDKMCEQEDCECDCLNCPIFAEWRYSEND